MSALSKALAEGRRTFIVLGVGLVAVCVGVLFATGVLGGDTDRGDETPSAKPDASSSTPSASPEGAEETDPVAFGEAVWEAFYGHANAGMGYEQWWAELEPLLSPAAAGVHIYDDPRTFPTVKVTGELAEAPVAPYTEGVTAEVYVPTNEGRYSLFLVRTSETAPWRLEHIGFPKGAQ